MRFLLCAIALALAAPAKADYTVWYTFDPYQGNSSKVAVGMNPGEACAGRTDEEIRNGFTPNPPTNPILYIGHVTFFGGEYCGVQWLNIQGQSSSVITQTELQLFSSTCAQLPANVPKPLLC